MPLSMYQASIPVFIHMLGNLRNILSKKAQLMPPPKTLMQLY
jgi:hypothetical protein